MGNATVGALRVVLGLDSASFTKGLTAAQKHLKGVGKQMQSVGQTVAGVGAGMTLSLTAPLLAFGAASIKAAAQSKDAMGQVEAALNSMGNASGRNIAQLEANAAAIQKMAAIDDDDILRDVTSNLLTFGNVSGKVFDRAQVAIVDVAARMKQGLQPAALMVGKALNDPIKGLGALRKVGIQFTADQAKMIERLTKTGNVAGAQTIMLKELERQFGGSAKAAADADPYARMQIALGELSETIGQKLLPIISPLIERVTALLNSFTGLSPAAQQFVLIGAAIAAALGPVVMIIGGLISAVGTIAVALGSGGILAGVGAAIAAAFWPITAIVVAAIAAFFLFRDEIGAAMNAVREVVTDVLGPKMADLFKAFGELWAALQPIIQPIIDAFAGSWSVEIAKWGDLIGRVFNAVVAVISGAITGITLILQAFTAALQGDWSAAFGYLLEGVKNFGRTVVAVFEALFPGVTEWVKRTYQGIKEWLVDRFVGIVESIRQKVAAVSGFFRDLWDAVVGHSYVPDMVKGIADWFGRLDAGMVAPAKKATAKVKAEFEKLRDDVAAVMDGLLTPEERAEREYQAKYKTLRDAFMSGKMGVTSEVFTEGVDRLNAERYPEKPIKAVEPFNGSGVKLPELPDLNKVFGQLMSPETEADLRGKFISFGQDLAYAIKSGDLEGFFGRLGDMLVDKLVGEGMAMVFDMFKNASWRTPGIGGDSGGGGGGGGWMSAISGVVGSIFGGGIPGFATGGSFKVGGAGGIDSKLIQFRATPGEMVDIRTPGQDRGGGGGSPLYFDMRGAVMTEDLLRQMQQLAGDAREGAVADARQIVPADMMRSQGRRLGGTV